MEGIRYLNSEVPEVGETNGYDKISWMEDFWAESVLG
jgi:hypothetical protein